MRTLILVVCVVVGCALVGCTASQYPPYTPSATVPSPTSISSPSPTWSDVEQGAVDAVYRYLEKWTYLAQNLQTPGVDLNEIWEVADKELATETLLVWVQWVQNGWHLVGGPVFTASSVTPGMRNEEGSRYHVYGCYSIEDSYLADSDGNQVGARGDDRNPVYYTVLQLSSGGHLVLGDTSREGTC